MSKKGLRESPTNPTTWQSIHNYNTSIENDERKRKKKNKQQTTSVKTQKNQTKSCCSYTQLGQIEARKWYRCLQTDRESVCVWKRWCRRRSWFRFTPKTPNPKENKKQIERNVGWIEWMVMIAGAKLVGGQNESNSGSHVPGLESLQSKGTPTEKEGSGG